MATAQTRPSVVPVKNKVSHLTLYGSGAPFSDAKKVKGPITDANDNTLEWEWHNNFLHPSDGGNRVTIRMKCTKGKALGAKGVGSGTIDGTGSLSVTLTNSTGVDTKYDNLDVTYTDDDPCQ